MVVKRAKKDVKRKLQVNVSRVTSEDKGEETDCDIAMCEAFDKEKEQLRKENARLKAQLKRAGDQIAALTEAVQRLSGKRHAPSTSSVLKSENWLDVGKKQKESNEQKKTKDVLG